MPRLAERFRVEEGSKLRLADWDTGRPKDLALDKDGAKPLMEDGRDRLRALQERLYAEGRWAVLIVLQGMDASGKDGVVEHVMSGINPQGCRVVSFKAPSSQELRHDFLWRSINALPERGQIAIFNRSHYEDVLVVRVHQDLLDKQSLPKACLSEHIWSERFESIRAFEKHLVRNGTLVLKFFLHLSKDEQKKRLLDRIEEPDKNWKFNAGDLAERQHWDDYMRVYEEAIAQTSTSEAPWYVVPADHKWLARLTIADTIASRLADLDLDYPVVDEAALSAMHRARAQLTEES